jgi:hypothetical protein
MWHQLRITNATDHLRDNACYSLPGIPFDDCGVGPYLLYSRRRLRLRTCQILVLSAVEKCSTSDRAYPALSGECVYSERIIWGSRACHRYPSPRHSELWVIPCHQCLEQVAPQFRLHMSLLIHEQSPSVHLDLQRLFPPPSLPPSSYGSLSCLSRVNAGPTGMDESMDRACQIESEVVCHTYLDTFSISVV